jgi:hypothetical protein
MSRSKRKKIDCPACLSGGIPITILGQYELILTCPLCGGSRKVSAEIYTAFYLIHEIGSNRYAIGKRLRETVPDLFPESWFG